MIRIPQDAAMMAKSRLRPHLEDLKIHSYSLEWLAMACYFQGIIDLLQLLEEQSKDETK